MPSKFDYHAFLKHCPKGPGVYRMEDAQGEVLYVGKASDLKARLSSYFQKNITSPKTRALVSKIHHIETTITHSEAEALLLEQSLIKELQPPYNILLRDDKSYPYIRLTTADDFPRITFHRGSRKQNARYFGPFPSSGSVRNTLGLMEKLFRLRTCQDSFFHNRSRPCLQYQIKRCTAPCVGLVSMEEYQKQVDMAVQFLSGKDRDVVAALSQQMEEAASELHFEKAAELRDRLIAIRNVQQKQYADTGRGNVDVIALASAHGQCVVEVLFIREGRILGNRSYFPRNTASESDHDILEAFLSQYYLGDRGDRIIPDEIIVNVHGADFAALQDAIGVKSHRKIRFASSVRKERQGWLRLAETNADATLQRRLADKESLFQRYQALQRSLDIDEDITRIECFDISHTRGEQAVASCVVFGPDGASKSEYRRFNVEPERKGDDYAALEEAVRRRYQRVKKEEGLLPSLLLIDGGKGQVSKVSTVLEELQLHDQMTLLGISKGPSRKAGLELLHKADGTVLQLAPDSPALHLLQQVRDEAHRFAIVGHRQRRSKSRKSSSLDQIPGVGPAKRKALLHHFGGLAAIKKATREELERVPGVSETLAEQIYSYLREAR